MSNIYIAGPWKDREQMPALATKVEFDGHKITHKWWTVDPPGEHTPEVLAACALQDLDGVLNADYLIVVNSAKSEGKAVEQGLAIAAGIPILAIGKRGEGDSKNVFHYLSVYDWFDDIEGALDHLTKLEKELRDVS